MTDEHVDDRKPSALWLPLLLLLLAGLGLVWWVAIRDDGGRLAADEITSPFVALNEDPLIDGPGLGNGAEAPEAWSEARWQQLERRTGDVSLPDVPPANLRPMAVPGAGAAASAARPKAPSKSGRMTFASLDRNKDGRLSPAEFAVFHVPGVEPRRQGAKADDMAPYVSTDTLNRSIGAFRRLDRNDDWFLSRAEFGSPSGGL